MSKFVSIAMLSKKQRKCFNEYWKANKHLFKGKRKCDYIMTWKDGFVCGKHSHKWEK